MNDLDRWARDHRHRAKRAQIVKLRCSRAAASLTRYMRMKMHEVSFMRRVLMPEPFK